MQSCAGGLWRPSSRLEHHLEHHLCYDNIVSKNNEATNRGTLYVGLVLFSTRGIQLSGFFENGSNLHILVLNLCRNAVENLFSRVLPMNFRWLDVLRNTALITREAAIVLLQAVLALKQPPI
jgi:hypothetical protein